MAPPQPDICRGTEGLRAGVLDGAAEQTRPRVPLTGTDDLHSQWRRRSFATIAEARCFELSDTCRGCCRFHIRLADPKDVNTAHHPRWLLEAPSVVYGRQQRCIAYRPQAV